jgi:apolipoprotein N-acyltransferase
MAVHLRHRPAPTTAPRRRDPAAAAAAFGGGALVALSLPPWGWWPLAFVGIAVLDRMVANRPARSRFFRTWLFGLAWLAPGMGWMWYLSAPGYVVAVAAYAGYLGLAAAIAPGGRWRRLALPAALTIAESVRFMFPFGGVPLASLGISQAYAPLSQTARLGGVILITWLTFMVGCALSAAWERSWRQAIALAAVPVGLIAIGLVAPSGHDGGRTLTIAIVQGGGPQGTHASDTDARVVFDRHIAATNTIDRHVDLVVWPENIIDVNDVSFADSDERAAVAAEAARLDAPFAVGVTEDEGDRFTNAQVLVLPDGQLAGRYDKVRRVPFGEYMPLRGLLKALGAPTDLVPRDALPGTKPAILDLPSGDRLGVMISWEVFFGGRARDGVSHGGSMLLNPTNGSSYTGTILQTQQIASSRLRALENGRWVAQVAPTGFSAFVTPSGHVLDRTGISEQAVRYHTVQLRGGRTIYSRIGEKPVVAAAVVVLVVGLLLARRDRRRAARLATTDAVAEVVAEDPDRSAMSDSSSAEGPTPPPRAPSRGRR